MNTKLDLEELKQMAENSVSLTSTARALSERDNDYYHGHQYTSGEIATLKKRGQPVVSNSRLKRKVDAMVGIEQRNRVDPKAYPRNPGDEDAALAASKALMFVDDNTNFDVKRSSCFEDMIINGYSGAEVIVEDKNGRLEIVINKLRWEEIFFDPHSREKDFGDAAYMGVMKWMSIDRAFDLYSESFDGSDEELHELLQTSLVMAQDGETYEDRPYVTNSFQWSDPKMKRVRVAQMYYKRSNEWHLGIFVAGGTIYNEISPYQDEYGNSSNPICLMTAYIDRDNNRYGFPRDLIDTIDEINKRRSKLLHIMNSRQTWGPKGAVVSPAAMKRELASPDGHIEVTQEAVLDARESGVAPFNIIPQSDQIAGQFSLLTESKIEIDQVGPNAALLGQMGSSASGRAIMAQQQAGYAELAPIYDSLRDWTTRVYIVIWERIRQYWTEKRWIRVSDDVKGIEFIGINMPTGEQQVAPDPETGMMMIRPVVENEVAKVNIDIIIQEAPDYVSIQQEQFEQMVQLAKNGIQLPPEMLIEASSLPNKADLLERLDEMQQAGAQGAQQQQQLEQRMQQAEVSKIASEVEENMADARKKQTEADENIAQIRAMGF